MNNLTIMLIGIATTYIFLGIVNAIAADSQGYDFNDFWFYAPINFIINVVHNAIERQLKKGYKEEATRVIKKNYEKYREIYLDSEDGHNLFFTVRTIKEDMKPITTKKGTLKRTIQAESRDKAIREAWHKAYHTYH